MVVMLSARLFMTFSKWGRDSCTSSKYTPPNPCRALSLSRLISDLPSLIWYGGLKLYSFRSALCEIFGLFGKASHSSHYWRKYIRNTFIKNCSCLRSSIKYNCSLFICSVQISKEVFSYLCYDFPNVPLLCCVQYFSECHWIDLATLMSASHKFNYFGENSKAMVLTTTQSFSIFISKINYTFYEMLFLAFTIKLPT